MDTTTYLSYRPLIQTGDILAVNGKGFASSVIKLWTRSKFSHVALFVRLKDVDMDRVFILHAMLKGGVHLLPASRYLSGLNGGAYWVPIDSKKASQINPNFREDIVRFSFTQLGRKYDSRAILGFAFRFLKQNQESYFCSELASEALREAGLDDRDSFVDPGEFLKSPVLKQPVSLI